MDEDILQFDLKNHTQAIIKVVGVGGGGSNAVNHMFHEGIHDVSFALCNTDNQALSTSPVPVKIQLGQKTTGGLGAGNKPEVARQAAEESIDHIKELFSDGTRMVFITAGMGGGTGTGAAPVIARIAKEMNILTIGIVTIPFRFEGPPKILQALRGVEEIANNVDALLVINNERLRDIYSDLTIMNAFAKADDTLAIAAKSIAEIITIHGHVNLDFADVNTTLKDGGVAIMSRGLGNGEDRISIAIEDALNSPLLNNNDVFSAKKILVNISYSETAPLMMEEMNAFHDFMSKFGPDIEVIWGAAVEEDLGEDIKITLLATGFNVSDVPGMIDKHTADSKAEEEKREIREKELQEQRERDNEKRLKEEALIKKYYGSDGLINNKPETFVLTLEELCDDKIIEILEKNPVYSRTSDFNPRANRSELSTSSSSSTSSLFDE